MKIQLNQKVILTIAKRTFSQAIESPIAYVVGLFFYGFIGAVYGLNFYINNHGSIQPLGVMAPWILWFVIPALTMNLISDELRSGTFESLSTLPVRDWEIVLGKYLGFCYLAVILIGGLLLYPFLISFVIEHPLGLDWGESIGVLAGLLFMSLFYGAMGLFASSLAKNQVVVLILGMIFCTVFFFLGQFFTFLTGFLAQISEFLGVTSHVNTLSRGVWDIRDLFYFISFIFIFLYFTVQRLSTRRF